MLFLRDTKDPEGDLRRGWSGHSCLWFSDEREARRHHRLRGTRAVLRDPVSGAWNADPEPGLSAFGFEDEASFAEVVRRMRDYACDPDLGFAVFESDDFEPEAGADGEDCFRPGTFLGRIPQDAVWDDVLPMTAGGAAPRRC